MAKKNVDIADMRNVLRDNYMIYAKSTIVERSFPFIDGYKPVQRRVLYSMWELNLDKASAKSARVVGDTMGKYHPHGDCSFPDTMLYCLSGEMLTIEQAYLDQKELEILAFDLKTRKVVPAIAKAFRIGQYTDKVYHIHLSNGTEIKCTSNHPILLHNRKYVKAEDLKTGDRLYNVIYDDRVRPMLNSHRLQDIVSDYYYGKLEKGYVKHHKDYNVFNNTKENFQIMTREAHALLHKDYLTGLDIGRQKMFEDGGEFRQQTKDKNSTLFKLFNEEQGIRRFLYWISKLEELEVDITEENYEELRKKDNKYGLEVYNLPKIDRLIKKGYGSTFEDLLEYKLKSVSELYSESTNKVDNIQEVEDKKCDFFYNKQIFIVFDKFSYDELLSNNMYERYIEYIKNNPKRSEKDYYKITKEDFDILLDIYFKKYIYVTSVEIEEVDNQPMYDFTVDNFENMLVPMFNENSKVFVCLHNSSIYGAMCQMADTYEGRNAAEIKAKGCFGKAWSTTSIPPAAYRYCVTGDSLVTTNKGIYAIKDLSKFSCNEDIDILVKGYSYKNHHVSKFFDSGKHPVITVVLTNGLKITGTYNHPIMINEGEEFNWKLLSELKLSDRVVISETNTNLFGDNNDIDEAKRLGEKYKKENYKEPLTQNILNGNKEYLSCFLSSFFQNAIKKQEDKEIVYIESSNELLLRQIQTVLQQNYSIFSILCSVDDIYNLTIESQDCYKFQRYIVRNEDFVHSKGTLHEMVGISNIIYEKEEQEVYSLKVDDETHSFCANGFINHNTEAKLTKCISECAFEDINNDAVDFIDNHDNTIKEPVLLPVKFPNIIVNTSSGVACGIKVYIPCYTLKNACEATIGLLTGKIKDYEGLARALDAPDFQTGGVINMSFEQKLELVKTGNTKGIYLTGRYKMNKQEMTIYELPYNTSCEKVTSQIEDCIKDRKIPGITRVVNGADKDGLGVVVFIQKGYEAEDIFKYLCAFTDVQTKMSFQTKFIHIDSETHNLNYKELGIFELLQDYWIPWRIETIRRVNRHKLGKLQIERHKLEAWVNIGDDIPTYVNILLNNTREDAKKIHMEKYGLDDEQEEYMLNHKVDGITIDGVLRAKSKLSDLLQNEKNYEDFIADEVAIKKQIVVELKDIVKKYATERKSSSEEFATLVHLSKEEATAIPDEDIWVGITEKGKLKKASNEKDSENFASKIDDNDSLWKVYPMNNKDKLLALTTAGFIYKFPVYSLDSSTRTNFKDSIWRFVNKDSKDKHKELEVRSDAFYVTPFGEGKDGFNIVYRTGYIKKIRFDAFQGRNIYRDQFPEYDEQGFIVTYDKMLCITNQNRAKVIDLSYMYDYDKPTKSNTLYRLSKLKLGEEIMCVLPLDEISSYLGEDLISYYTKRYFVRIRRNEVLLALNKYITENTPVSEEQQEIPEDEISESSKIVQLMNYSC